MLVYTARVTPDIAHSIDDVDRAMRWGFAWDIGPFETWDAIGVREVLEACDVDRRPAARAGGAREGPQPLPRRRRCRLRRRTSASSRRRTDRNKVLKKNPGASLVDLGDGVLCVEFHSKMNAIGPDTGQMVLAGIQEAEKNFRALVVGNDAPNFSVGANLMLVLLEAQEGNWDDLDLMIRQFQNANMALRYAERARGGRPGGHDPRRRLRGGPARQSHPGGRGNLHGPRRGRAWA